MPPANTTRNYTLPVNSTRIYTIPANVTLVTLQTPTEGNRTNTTGSQNGGKCL